MMRRNLMEYVEEPGALRELTRPEIDALDPRAVREFQLRALKRSLQRGLATIPAVRKLAENVRVDSIDNLDGILPLLFMPDRYKSYDESWLDEMRFDKLTRWFDELTAADLSGLDTSGCRTLQDWCELLRRERNLFVVHSSGTSGVLSFLPRMEADTRSSAANFAWTWQPMRGDARHVVTPGKKNDLTLFFPGPRRQFRSESYMFDIFEETYGMNPTQTVMDSLGPDLVVAMAKIRTASEEDRARVQRIPRIAACREAAERYQKEYPKRMEKWFDNLVENYLGQRVVLFGYFEMMHRITERFQSKGIRGGFHPDSVFVCGGGVKDGSALPAGWKEEFRDVLGVSPADFMIGYGMAEVSGNGRQCPSGHFHFQPWTILYLLHPGTRKAMPRQGVQTGRLAVYDLLGRGYWGGVVTGDRATVDWESTCPCGRPAPFIPGDSIGRL